MAITHPYRLACLAIVFAATTCLSLKAVAAPKDRPIAQRIRGALQQAEESVEQRRGRFRFQPQGAPPNAAAPLQMPKVLLTNRDQKVCKVKVGDALPAFELPKVGGSESVKLEGALGKRGTVIVFWKGDRRAARAELADLGPEVVEPFGKNGVSVVGIAVQETADSATQTLAKADAKFTNVLDADGNVFNQVGSECLPRTYVLDSSGKIVWFDIAYSLATRRDLNTALRVLTETK